MANKVGVVWFAKPVLLDVDVFNLFSSFSEVTSPSGELINWPLGEYFWTNVPPFLPVEAGVGGLFSISRLPAKLLFSLNKPIPFSPKSAPWYSFALGPHCWVNPTFCFPEGDFLKKVLELNPNFTFYGVDPYTPIQEKYKSWDMSDWRTSLENFCNEKGSGKFLFKKQDFNSRYQ